MKAQDIVDRAYAEKKAVMDGLADVAQEALDRWQARKEVQADVALAVERRGYRDGWREESFLARQVAKFVEELGELMMLIYPRGRDFLPKWKEDLLISATRARLAFDDVEDWERAEVGDLEAIKGELADLQVVLFCAAQAVGELCGDGFDVVEAARQKALGDVERGVRDAE